MSLVIDETEDVLEEQEQRGKDNGVKQKAVCDIKWKKSISTKCIQCNRQFTQERKRGMRKTR